MNYTTFKKERDSILARNPAVIDCAETNLYSTLEYLIPKTSSLSLEKVHRCHLAQEWLDLFCLSDELSPGLRPLVSCGVRDSLSKIFDYYAERKSLVWLPNDNYPVYWEIAKESGLSPYAFSTLPILDLPSSPDRAGEEVLLLTNPLKPLGRFLSDQEVADIKSWLAASTLRRIVIDAVYTFTTSFHPSTLSLIETGQAILLHSLTKGWLSPRLFGIALLPEPDATNITEAFRASPPPQVNLAKAREYMKHLSGLPQQVGKEIANSKSRLLDHIPLPLKLIISPIPESYFIPVAGSWMDILEKENILGIPASVFGSAQNDITILSSLGFA